MPEQQQQRDHAEERANQAEMESEGAPTRSWRILDRIDNPLTIAADRNGVTIHIDGAFIADGEAWFGSPDQAREVARAIVGAVDALDGAAPAAAPVPGGAAGEGVSAQQTDAADVVYDALSKAGLITSCPTTETYSEPLELESGDVLEIASAVVAALQVAGHLSTSEKSLMPERPEQMGGSLPTVLDVDQLVGDVKDPYDALLTAAAWCRMLLADRAVAKEMAVTARNHREAMGDRIRAVADLTDAHISQPWAQHVRLALRGRETAEQAAAGIAAGTTPMNDDLIARATTP